MKDIFDTSSQLVAVILATLISIQIYSVDCEDEFPTVHHENQQPFFSDFPFADSTSNSESLVSKGKLINILNLLALSVIC